MNEYPFPGMNPWLEDPQLWRGMHTRIIAALGNELAGILAPRYFVDVETHTYISAARHTPLRVRYPDVTVIGTGRPGGAAVAVAEPARLSLATPVEIDLMRAETIEEPFLQIRFVPGGEVVTVIELLSHTNKRPGAERDNYIEKRDVMLDAHVHFVEIDLLRAWPPMPYADDAGRSDYRIFIHRRNRRLKAYLYPFDLRDAIPVFPLPLLPGDPEPAVNLSALLQEIYTQAHYELIIDYTRPPTPSLSKADAEWAELLVR